MVLFLVLGTLLLYLDYFILIGLGLQNLVFVLKLNDWGLLVFHDLVLVKYLLV